jgi:xylulokinase
MAAGYAPQAAAAFLRRAGAPPSLGGDDTAGHLAYLSGRGKEIGDRARWFLEPMDYLSMRFTGEAVATSASMCASWLFDTRDPNVTAFDATLVKRLGVDGAKLPRIVAVGSRVGTVTALAGLATGLVPGTPVVTGLPDLHSACVGSGAVEDFQAHLAISTTSWLSCPVRKKKTDIAHSIATVTGITKDRYLVVNNQDSGGRCLDWLGQHLLSGNGGAPSIPELLALAETVPAGAGGVQFTPWLAGERTPISDRHARGGFNNVGLETSRHHLVRATLEGVAMNSRWLLQSAEKFTKHRFDAIRLIGGGAQSPLWCQIMADVMDRTIEQVEDPRNANLRGMALFAAMAVSETDLATSAAKVTVAQTFTPKREHRGIYDDAFGRFTATYAAQKKIFRNFNAHRPE